MSISPELKAAYSQPIFIAFGCLQIVLNTGEVISLLDGSSEVTFNDTTFRGSDETWGSLSSVEAVEEGIADTAPRCRIGLNTSSNEAMATLALPQNQGSVVLMWVGALDGMTGAVIPNPEVYFFGRLDRAQRAIGKGTATMELDLSTYWEELFLADEGFRLNAQFLRSIWPDDAGLDFVTEVTRQLPWGADVPRPQVISGYTNTPTTGGSVGGGGGIGGWP